MTTLAEAHALVAEQARCHIALLAPHRRFTGLTGEDLQQEVWVIVGRLLARYDPAAGDLAHYLRASLPWELGRVVRGASPQRFQRATTATPVTVQGQRLAWWAGAARYRGAPDEDATALREALGQLPPTERAVVLWHVEEGLDFTAIAARMGRARSTVFDLWQRAAGRLRAYYADEAAG